MATSTATCHSSGHLDTDRINNLFKDAEKSYRDLAKRHAAGLAFLHRPSVTGEKGSDEIRILRDKILVVEESIRSQVLLVETFYRALKSVESTYYDLRIERNDLEDEINALVRENNKPISLPNELIAIICSYLPKEDFNSVYKVWGDIAYEAISMEHSFDQLFKRSKKTLEKSSLLEIADYIHSKDAVDQILEALKKSAPKSRGLWKCVSLEVDCSIQSLLSLVFGLKLFLSSVKALSIKQGIRASNWDNHSCTQSRSGCLQGIRGGACTRLSLPLALLPCFANFNPGGIFHLEVDIRHGYPDLRDFRSHLQGFRITDLQSLAIRLRSTDDFTLGDRPSELPAPCLRMLSIQIEKTVPTLDYFLGFVGCVEAPNLETLELIGVVKCEREDSSYEGSGLGDEEVDSQSSSIAEPRYLLGESRKFGATLLCLSLPFRIPDRDDILSFLSNLFKDLHSPERGAICFPQLIRLAIPYPLFDFDRLHAKIKALSEYRENAGAPIPTIEMVLDEVIKLTSDQEYSLILQAEQLELFSRNLTFTSNTNDGGDDNSSEMDPF